MTIMVILTTLVIAAFQRDDGDRLNASSRLLQSYLEGAKSRAISDGQVRGVRIIQSANDPYVAGSLVYIGASGYDTGFCDIEFISATGLWRVTNKTPGEWERLADDSVIPNGRSLLRPGSRIEIPSGAGTWYHVSAVGFTTAEIQSNRVSISEHYSLSSWNNSLVPPGYEAQLATNVPYRLELAATTLPNNEPLLLQRGTVIDLAASRLSSLDILFDSRGNPTGPLVSKGLIHLYLTTVGDVERTRALFPLLHPANSGGPVLLPISPPFVPSNAPTTPANEPYLVSVFTQTGQITTSRVDLTDVVTTATQMPPRDFRADDPYSYARRGREAQ